MPSAVPVLPSTQTAIVCVGKGKLAISDNVSVPPLQPGMVMVRTTAVALNPVDAKMVDYSPAVGAIDGYDYAGEIVAMGSGVSSLSVGDRVCGMVHGMNSLAPEIGAFAQYVAAPAEFVLKAPSYMSDEEAASLGTGVATVGLALFHSLKIPAGPTTPLAPEKSFFVLVYGASTATGTMALQVLKLCGVRAIGVCSPKHFDLVRGYGAEAVFDYSSPTCGADIRTYTQNTCKYALDCITEASTMAICYEAIGRAGGRYCALEPYPERQHTRKAIAPDWVLGLTMYGKKVAMDGVYGREALAEDYEFAKKWFPAVQELLDGEKLRTHPLKCGSGSFAGVLEGIDTLRKRMVSGQKLVYRIV